MQSSSTNETPLKRKQPSGDFSDSNSEEKSNIGAVDVKKTQEEVPKCEVNIDNSIFLWEGLVSPQSTVSWQLMMCWLLIFSYEKKKAMRFPLRHTTLRIYKYTTHMSTEIDA